VALKLTSR